MAWAVTFKQDTDANGEGTIVATNGSFTYEKRINTNNTTKVDEFVANAKSKFATYSSKNTDEGTVAATILTKLEA